MAALFPLVALHTLYKSAVTRADSNIIFHRGDVTQPCLFLPANVVCCIYCFLNGRVYVFLHGQYVCQWGVFFGTLSSQQRVSHWLRSGWQLCSFADLSCASLLHSGCWSLTMHHQNDVDVGPPRNGSSGSDPGCHGCMEGEWANTGFGC